MGEKVDKATLDRAREALTKIEDEYQAKMDGAEEAVRAITTVLVVADFPEVEEVYAPEAHVCPDPGVKRSKRAKTYPYPPGKLLDPDKPNPTGYCVYDELEDPASDSCLYCGDPYERK